jgi:hypothetical protein
VQVAVLGAARHKMQVQVAAQQRLDNAFGVDVEQL